jgi:CheY-like chemotaxis protein
MGHKTMAEGSARILYVDDEQSLALLGEEFLGDLGYQVTAAFSGPMALELFKQAGVGYELVITDESMPGMSGIELAGELARISPRTPVILCSGHLLTMHEEGVEQTNIKAVLVKTEVCSKLPALIEQILRS